VFVQNITKMTEKSQRIGGGLTVLYCNNVYFDNISLTERLSVNCVFRAATIKLTDMVY